MIKIQRCGYNSNHQRVFEMLRKNNGENYLLLIVKSPAFFEYKNEVRETPSNIVFLFDRESYIHYGSTHSHYNDDWIHFHFDGEDIGFMEQLQIPFQEPLFPAQISLLSDYCRLIVREQLSDSHFKDEILTSLMKTLLYSLQSQLMVVQDETENHKYYNVMNKLKSEIYNSPHKSWSVNVMANYVNMSPSYFQYLYRKLFGISCGNDVVQARIEAAKFYLVTTDMSVRSVAELCGYQNELHFMRQFKKKTNFTPSKYRLSKHNI